MAIEVEMSDGSIAEFPDGTPNDVMQRAAQEYHRRTWKPKRRTPDDLREAAMRYERDNAPATEGQSGLHLFGAGVGKSIMDTGLGIRQIGADLGIGDAAEVQQDVDRRAQDDDALLRSGAGVAGNIGGQIGQMLLPVANAGRVVTYAGKGASALKGAVNSAAFAATQPVTSDRSRAQNVGVAGAAGAAGVGLQRGLQGLAAGARSRLDPIARELAEKAEGYGINLGAGQISNNPMVRTLVSQMERLPFSGARKANEGRQEAFNRAVGNTFGAPEAKITPEVFAKAADRIGGQFETIAARNALPASPQLLTRMGAVRAEAEKLAGSDTARMVNGWINELLGKADASGKIPGAAYKSFDSRIGKAAAAGGEPGYYLGQVRETARKAMDSAISPRDKAAWDLARKQWAALKTVEPLVAKGADISPQALMGRVTADKAGKARMAKGRAGDQGDLARIGQRFLRESPNSGTADRLAVNAAIGGGLFGLQQYGVIDPSTALATGALLAGNRAGLGVLNSRALTQGNSRTLQGLARLAQPAPQALPAWALANY